MHPFPLAFLSDENSIVFLIAFPQSVKCCFSLAAYRLFLDRSHMSSQERKTGAKREASKGKTQRY